MVAVLGLRALHYSLDRFGSDTVPDGVRLPSDGPARGRTADLTNLACPPYDVISPAQRRELLARSPYNAVRLELGEAENQHRAAARTLADWRSDGTLVRDTDETLFTYRSTDGPRSERFAVTGVLARIRLEPWGESVRPHERTMPGPKADRLSLLRATNTQLSPILMAYFDPSEPDLPAGTDAWRARDDDGLLHELAEIAPGRWPAALSRQRLIVADGHHRYETALAHQAEVRGHPDLAAAPAGALGADWVMAVLVNAARQPMEVRPTHRLLVGIDPERLRRALTAPGSLFSVLPVHPADLPARLAELRHAEEPIFGVALGSGEGWLLVGDRPALADRMRGESVSPVVGELDLAILHTVVLGDWLGIGVAELEAGETVLYTRRETEALNRVNRGEASAAILVRPTELDQLAAVARAGELMPQKSTYFYPKLLTGLAFYPLED